jgi:hypothetical protein
MRECQIWIAKFWDDWILEKHFEYLKGLNGSGLCDHLAHENGALPADHHILWDEFHTTFHVHHLFAGLLLSKLKEFLDL